MELNNTGREEGNKQTQAPDVGRGEDSKGSQFSCCPASVTAAVAGWNGFRQNSYKPSMSTQSITLSVPMQMNSILSK